MPVYASLDLTTAAPTDDGNAPARERALADWLRARGSVLIGYSGGVDSAYLAAVAVEALSADRVVAVIGRSASYPAAQWQAARDVAAGLGLTVREIETHELDDPRYAANPSNRCYFCKGELWGRLVPLARELDLAVVVDGTNADDLHTHRPGMAAAREWGVASPLAEVGLTKAEIRDRSRARGLTTWSQPASPCLSSRLPTGTHVTPLRLAKVEAAERAVRALGVMGDLRVRYHGETARVELASDALATWRTGASRRALRDAVTGAGFARVELDLRGFRSGGAAQPADAAILDVLEA
jgi:uncharacterized protein